MDEPGLIQPITTWVWSLVVLADSFLLLENIADGLLKAMSAALILRLEPIHCRPQDGRRLVQEL